MQPEFNGEMKSLVSMVSGQGRGPPVVGLDGNWACPTCQNVNYGVRTACNRCQMPKPVPGAVAPPAAAQCGGRKGPVAGVDGNWACSACGNVNFAVRDACNMCQRPKQMVAPAFPPAPPAGAAKAAGRGPVAGVDGNWGCTFCGNVNFAIRQACNRCQGPRPAPQPVHVVPPPQQHLALYTGGGAGGGSRGAPVVGVDGNWACSFCRNVNYGIRDACNRCQSPRPVAAAPAPQPARRPNGAPVAGLDGNWACGLCGNVNFAIREACNRCQAPKQDQELQQQPQQQEAEPPGGRPAGLAPVAGMDGNWACPQCRNVNFAHRVACNRCQAPMPGAPGRAPGRAPVAGVDGNWACPLCHNVNFGIREACNRCQLPKPLDEPLEAEELDPDAALIEQLMQPPEEEPAAKRLKS